MIFLVCTFVLKIYIKLTTMAETEIIHQYKQYNYYYWIRYGQNINHTIYSIHIT